MTPLNVADFEDLARSRLDPVWYGYFAGGACDESTLADNVAAFRRVRLRQRVLVDVDGVTTDADVLGARASLPLAIAPIAYQRFAHPDGEEGMARAATAAGVPFCLSTLATATPAAVRAAAPGVALAYQVYVFRDRAVTADLVAEALDAGARSLLLTVDVPVVGKRERERRGGWALPEVHVPAVVRARAAGSTVPGLALFDPSVGVEYLERLCASVPVPVVVKGVLTGEDAVLAADHGAAGVVVSNHGGRQLDGVAAALDALTEVVDAVGHRVEVLVDGGVRRGTDVVKALALGARGALVGRAPLWGLAAAGEAGARAVLEVLREELALGLALGGHRSPADVGADAVSRPPPPL